MSIFIRPLPFKKDYQGLFQAVAEKFGEFVRDLNDLVGSLSKYISEGKDGKIKLKTKQLANAIQALSDKWFGNTDYNKEILYPLPDPTTGIVTGTTREECEAVAKQLGLPLKMITRADNGKYYIDVDIGGVGTSGSILDQLRSVIPVFVVILDTVEIDAAKWNAIYNAFDTQKQNLNTIMNGFTDKYSNSQTVFNAAIEILNKFLDQFLDLLRNACRA